MTTTNPSIVTQVDVPVTTGRVISDADLKTIQMDPGYILVDRIPPAKETEGGIVIPQDSQDERNFGFVIAVPPAQSTSECPYSVGDLVAFQYGSGVILENYDKERYLLILEIERPRPQVLAWWKSCDIKHIAKRFGYPVDDQPADG